MVFGNDKTRNGRQEMTKQEMAFGNDRPEMAFGNDETRNGIWK